MSQQPRIPYFQKIILDLLPGYLGKAFDQLTSFWNDHDTGTKQWTVVNTALLQAAAILGSTTGTAVAAGNVGEILDSSISAGASGGATTVWANITSLPLTTGVWAVTGNVSFKLNGATVTVCQGGISLFSGSTTTDMVNGKNIITQLPPTSAADSSAGIPRFMVYASGSQTVYLKSNVTYSAGTPKVYGYISALRVA